MELTQEQVVEAMTANPSWAGPVFETIQETETVKKLITNKANSIFENRIDEKTKDIHTQYDNDVFEILGERPGQNDDGQKMKTYDFMKKLIGELKDLRGKKEGLTKDAEVIRLQTEIEKLKGGEGYTLLKEQFDTAKEQWGQEKEKLENERDTALSKGTDYQKGGEIDKALIELKFAPEVAESVQGILKKTAKQELLSKSKITEDGKVIFVGEDGKTILNPTTYEPATAAELLAGMDSIKDVVLNKDAPRGGGAEQVVKTTIKTETVEGKDKKSLQFPAGSFKTQSEFIKVAEDAMLKEGITRHDPNWDKLKTEAYKEHKVSEMPAQ